MKEKVDDIYEKINTLEEIIFSLKNTVDRIDVKLSEYISNTNEERGRGEAIVKNIESQLKLFPDLFSKDGAEMGNVKSISSSFEGISEKLKAIQEIYKKNIDNQ